MPFNARDKTGKTEFPFSKQVVFRTVCIAIESLKGMVIEHRDDLATQLDVKVGVSAFSWGEKVKIVVAGSTNNSSELFVQSAPKTMLGAPQGKNLENIKKIISLTSKLIAEHGPEWEEEIELNNNSSQRSHKTKHSHDGTADDQKKNNHSPETQKGVISTVTEVTLIRYFEQKKYTNGDRIYLFPNIPAKLLSSAIAAYKLEIEPQEVVVLIDNTMFGSAKDGCLICQSRVIFRDSFSDATVFKYEKINVIQSQDKKIFINGNNVFKFNMPDSPALLVCFQSLNDWLSQQYSNTFVVTESITYKVKNESPNKVAVAGADLAAINNKKESTTTEKLIGFVSGAIEQNKSKIIPFLKEKTGEISIATLRDDKNTEKLAMYLYAFLPEVVRFALKEHVFIEFMMENRNKIIELILSNDLGNGGIHENEVSGGRSAVSSLPPDDKLLKQIHKIKAKQKNARDQLETELMSEIIDQDESDGIIMEHLFFFILDSHIKLVNENLSHMSFMARKDDELNNAACAQLLTSLLCLYCTSMTSKRFIEDLGEEQYYQVAGVAIAYYEKCAEIATRDDIYYDRLNVCYRHTTKTGDALEAITALFAKPIYEDHGTTLRPRSELIIDILGTEPLHLPKIVTIDLLKKSTEIHKLWLKKIAEIEQHIPEDEELSAEESNSSETSSRENQIKRARNSLGIAISRFKTIFRLLEHSKIRPFTELAVKYFDHLEALLDAGKNADEIHVEAELIFKLADQFIEVSMEREEINLELLNKRNGDSELVILLRVLLLKKYELTKEIEHTKRIDDFMKW